MLRIATRSSQLALWQANYVADLLRERNPNLEVELIHVSTTGDRDQREALRSFGGMGVFTREVQNAVLDGRADVAVHSLKDLPTEPAEGLKLASTPERVSVLDALILPANHAEKPVLSVLDWLPEAARVGTGSPRRQAQLRFFRPDLQLLEIRGNLDTRLRKLDEGEYDAIVLADAGLTRLGMQDRITARLTPPLMYPAVSQGSLGLECRSDDETTQAALATICHRPTFQTTTAERAVLSGLRAGCHAPLGAYCIIEGDLFTLNCVVLDPQGTSRITARASGSLDDPHTVASQVVQTLLEKGVREWL